MPYQKYSGTKSFQKNNILWRLNLLYMFERYSNIAHRIFGWVPERFPSILKLVEFTLPKSGIDIPKKTYISIVCLTVFLTYLVSLVVSISLLLTFFKLEILMATLIIVFAPFITGILTFMIGMFYPYQKVMSRKKSISTNLPFAIAHMGAIAASGVPPTVVFKLLSRFEEYDVLAEEMKKITRNIEVFGLDPMSAIREVAKRTPSGKLRQLLLGLVSTMEGGGNIKTYLKNAGEQALFTWRMKRQKYVQQLSTYAEFYTGLLIAAPLFLISLFSVMYMIQPQLGGFDILKLMKLSIYLVVPGLNVGFLVFLQLTQVEM